MGLFRRVNDILCANLNDLVDRFEDPEKMLRQAVREMERGIADAMDAAARALANEKLLARELADTRGQADAWRARAQRALGTGDDALARAAVERALESDSLAAALADQATRAADVASRMRRQVDGLHARLADARRRLRSLSLRRQGAASLRQGSVAPGAAHRPDGFARFTALEGAVARAEAEAEAWCELTAAPGDGLDGLVADERAEAVDAELARLRAGIA